MIYYIHHIQKSPLRVSYNFLQASDVMEVDKYFKVQMKNNVKVILPKEKSLT